MPKDILLAGLYHETLTFLPETTGLEAFPFSIGKAILEMRGNGSPIDGFLEAAESFGWNVIPLLDARAMPSGMVEDAVIEDYWTHLKAGLLNENASRAEALMLILHGAMVAESFPDVEGELLKRIRQLPGFAKLPIFIVLDLHANATPEMANYANASVAYRKNPHTDARETAIRAAHLLKQCLDNGRFPVTYHREPRMLLPPLSSGTHFEPMTTFLNMAEALNNSHPDFLEVNVLAGFPFADTPHAGISFSVVTTGDPAPAKKALDELCSLAWQMRSHTRLQLPEAIDALKDWKPHSKGPTLLVETADNIGGGTAGDATGALRAVLELNIQNAAAVINDPEAVRQLQEKTLSSEAELSIGGKRNPFDEGPLSIRGILKNKSDGTFTLEDRQSHMASMSGVHIDMGPCAVVETQGIEILLTSRPTPPFDLGQLRSQGIQPESKSLIVVKAAVGHKQAYDPITAQTIWVETPGPCPTDLSKLPYRKLNRPKYPLDNTKT